MDKPIWDSWDRTAVVTLTRGGMHQGQRLLSSAPGSTLYVPKRLQPDQSSPAVRSYDEAFGVLLPRLFAEHQALVVFAALGVVVRVLAPVLRDKRVDPAVVVVDEEARHAISVLSGHRGGANRLARAVAAALGARAVLTTATEVQGFPALDLLGERFGWRLDEEAGLTEAAAALVNGQPLLICQEAGETDWWAGELPPHVRVVADLREVDVGAYAAVVLITDRALSRDERSSRRWPPLVIYRPRTLAVGIGCERGVSAEEIAEAVQACCSQHGLAFGSLAAIGSIDRKRDEPGLLTFAERCELPLRWYSAEELRAAGGPTPSAIVEGHVGAPGVAEPAARLASGMGGLLCTKTKHGRVTVAIARLAAPARGPGKIFLVGLGPGDRADLTPRAVAALEQAEVVLGYHRYLEQIDDLLTGKTVIRGQLTKERERAEETVALALAGKTVALVSSGDSGIYGMAGLVFEVLGQRSRDARKQVQVEVVPGISALSSCAALLGAPLMNDFAAISLSDRLTPWPLIASRLEAAAQADLVIVLYNPKSARRITQFEEACRILLKHRSGGTPVGLVTRAGRPGCRTMVTTLARLSECEVDMETTILVGNSSTRLVGDWLVTPRGYPAAVTVLAAGSPEAEGLERS